jgi:small subunit ribosomal protein S17
MKAFRGVVLRKIGEKTAVVAVDSFVEHPVYKKRYMVRKKYHVHDIYSSKVGQKVQFVASKPYSRLKKWIIIKPGETVKVGKKREKKMIRKNKK